MTESAIDEKSVVRPAAAPEGEGLLSSRTYFKPFRYPWAYEAFMQSEQMH